MPLMDVWKCLIKAWVSKKCNLWIVSSIVNWDCKIHQNYLYSYLEVNKNHGSSLMCLVDTGKIQTSIAFTNCEK